MSNSRSHRKPLPLAAFAVVALTPLPLFALAISLGGFWVWAGFLYMAGFVALLDQLLPHIAGDADEGQEFPGSDALLGAIGVSALALLPLATWATAGTSGLSGGERVLVFLGCGFWLGQVGHPASHELIHSSNRWLFRLGAGFYAAALFGQHASAHRLVHHVHVATDRDPNSARDGESFYRFFLRAWLGSFQAGWRAEDALRARASSRPVPHPYHLYLLVGAISLGLGYAIAGLTGTLVWLALGLHVQVQILVSDYVQHYGLRRLDEPNGKPEPVNARHSWNTAHWASSALMLNAPRHSDHHSHPARPYPALRLPEGDAAPRLPWPLPVACTLAFFPTIWKRALRRQLKPWRRAKKVTEG